MLLPKKIRIVGAVTALSLTGFFFVLVASADMRKQGERRESLYQAYREESNRVGEIRVQIARDIAEKKKAEAERIAAEQALLEAEKKAEAAKAAETLKAQQALLAAKQKAAALKAQQAAALAAAEKAAKSTPKTKRTTKSS